MRSCSWRGLTHSPQRAVAGSSGWELAAAMGRLSTWPDCRLRRRLRTRERSRTRRCRAYHEEPMPADEKTPPGSGQKRAGRPVTGALGIGAGSAVERAAQGIAEAALAAQAHAPQGVLGTALQGISPAAHLTKQIEEISKGVAGRTGASWAEQLGKTYATDINKTLGVAGLAPGI